MSGYAPHFVKWYGLTSPYSAASAENWSEGDVPADWKLMPKSSNNDYGFGNVLSFSNHVDISLFRLRVGAAHDPSPIGNPIKFILLRGPKSKLSVIKAWTLPTAYPVYGKQRMFNLIEKQR